MEPSVSMNVNVEELNDLVGPRTYIGIHVTHHGTS